MELITIAKEIFKALIATIMIIMAVKIIQGFFEGRKMILRTKTREKRIQDLLIAFDFDDYKRGRDKSQTEIESTVIKIMDFCQECFYLSEPEFEQKIMQWEFKYIIHDYVFVRAKKGTREIFLKAKREVEQEIKDN